MITEIDKRLEELVALWVDGNGASLRKIPCLCGEIIECAGRDARLTYSPNLLQRVGLLAGKAEQRLRTCVEIQSRTGSYSTSGALELARRIVTAGWEA